MNKIGLALEGGGAKGAYHVGVVTALYESGYSFDAVVGTSIGALNAAILAQDGLEVLKEFWQTVRISNIFDIDDNLADSFAEKGMTRENLMETIKLMRHPFKFVQTSGNLMETYVKQRIFPEKLLESKIKVGCVTYCVNKRKAVELFVDDMEKEHIVDYFIASATYPLYGFYEFGGNKYIDGGVIDNLPINLIASKGYKDIVAVRTSNKPLKTKIDYDVNVRYVIPSEQLGNMIAFVKPNINRCLKVGYYDGLRFVNGYLGKKYYIKPFDNNKFEEYFLELPYEDMLEFLGRTLKVRAINLRMLKEYIKHDLSGEISDSDCLLSIVELVAASFKIDRFCIFTIDELLRQIRDEANKCSKAEEWEVVFSKIKNNNLRKLAKVVAKYIAEKTEIIGGENEE